MKRTAIALLVIASLPVFAPPTFAASAKFMASLKKLEPKTRLEQVCDLEAMSRIRGSDRAKSDVIARPIHSGQTLTVNGGAVRQKGKWYRLSFVCKATPDGLKVTSFTYKVGAAIPEKQWAGYSLWR